MRRRPKVLFLGAEPQGAIRQDAAGWGLTIDVISSCDVSDDRLARAKGLIVEWPAPNGLDSLIARAAMHGVRVLLVSAFADVPILGRQLEAVGVKKSVTIRTDVRQALAVIDQAQTVASWNKNVIVEGGDELNPEEQVLLRRAFQDCTRIRLIPQSGGSRPVYQVYGRLEDSRAGPVALPFFLKFGPRKLITQELQNYQDCTTLHVPFNQRPNVDPARCVLGHRRGVVVANFVERSESLQTVIDRGAGLAALQSLFGSALRGWRLQAHLGGDSNTAHASMASAMARCCPSRFKPYRMERLRKHVEIAKARFHAGLSIDELEQRLRKLSPVSYRYAMAHNDLHGENVRVAGQDAILIDFTRADSGPLAADPASLDVSVVLDTTSVSDGEWERLASSLYSMEQLRRVPPPAAPEDPFAHIVDAVRFIRQVMVPDALSPLEYPTAVALQLLRKASYQDETADGFPRRAFAYALAERLVLQLEVLEVAAGQVT